MCVASLKTHIKFYLPPTKLQDGNLFSLVCPSFCPGAGESHVTITHDALDLTIQGPPPPTDLTGQGPSRHVHKLVHYEAHTVCKWAVSILLECFLVTVRNSSCGKVMFLHLSVILFTGGGVWADTPWADIPPGQTP